MNKNVWHCLLCFLLFASVGLAANKKFTLVIDPGHGGRDHGAAGVYSKEKDLVLKFALAFGQMVERNCPDVRVIYTRKTDVFIPLARRAEIANKNHADLFISIHINALSGGRRVRGLQTYTLGRGQNTGQKGIMENLEVAKRENSVIFLEKDYKQKYQGFDPSSPESNIMFEFIQDKNMQQSVELARYMQNHIRATTGLNDMGAHQNNLAVLRLSSMPGCLLELGFISTPEEEDFMNAAGAADMYARGIFNAFVQYKNKYHQGLVVPYKAPAVPEPQVPEIVPQDYKEQSKKAESAKKVKTREVSLAPNVPQPKVAETSSTNQQTPQMTANQSGVQATTATPQPTEVAPNAKNTVRTSAQTPTSPVANPAQEVPVFKIQILTTSRKLALTDAALKGLKGCEWYEAGGDLKYTYGSSADYNEIRRLRKEIIDRFPDAFIIAFKNGQRMDVNEAIRTFLQNKKK
ncbi:N-acetylmuramoyl-L-alanine amidase [Prevotella sp. SGI.027]|nr:N-acetylmuramoyl-L-alanine amidase [Prevotella sp.]